MDGFAWVGGWVDEIRLPHLLVEVGELAPVCQGSHLVDLGLVGLSEVLLGFVDGWWGGGGGGGGGGVAAAARVAGPVFHCGGGAEWALLGGGASAGEGRGEEEGGGEEGQEEEEEGGVLGDAHLLLVAVWVGWVDELLEHSMTGVVGWVGKRIEEKPRDADGGEGVAACCCVCVMCTVWGSRRSWRRGGCVFLVGVDRDAEVFQWPS